MPARISALCIDALDPPTVAGFWAAVLGWEAIEEGDEGVSLAPPGQRLPTLDVLNVGDTKQGKNRLHLDLRADGSSFEDEVARLEGLGARRVDVGQGPDVTWIVYADPEGNEFCLLRRTVQELSDHSRRTGFPVITFGQQDRDARFPPCPASSLGLTLATGIIRRVATALRRAVAAFGMAVLTASLLGCSSSRQDSYVPATSLSTRPRSSTSPGPSSGIAGVAVSVVHTSDGQVGYRQLGTGMPLVLIMGLGGSIDAWPPSFVDTLARHFRVIVADNPGVGRTSALPSGLTPSSMADQTSALITALDLGRVDVLGWSLGGMVAQALAVQHPAQVEHLVLAATQPGTGRAAPIPQAAAADAASPDPAAVLSVLFPADQRAAEKQYVTGILSYPRYYSAPRAVVSAESGAVSAWLAGSDPSGPGTTRITIPTLVADGSDDALDPESNDRMLAGTIPGAQLVIYPDAGHAFLFQDSAAFTSRVEQFLSA